MHNAAEDVRPLIAMQPRWQGFKAKVHSHPDLITRPGFHAKREVRFGEKQQLPFGFARSERRDWHGSSCSFSEPVPECLRFPRGQAGIFERPALPVCLGHFSVNVKPVGIPVILVGSCALGNW